MSIQSGINQSISNISAIAMLNPSLRAMAEKRQELSTLKQKEKVLAEQHEIATEQGPSDEAEFLSGKERERAMGFVDLKVAERAQKGLTDIAQERFDIKPTKQSYEDLLQSEYDISPAVSPESSAKYKTFKKYSEELQKAKDATVAKQDEKRAGRRHFMSYLKEEPITGGITVSQLSKDAQKQIASKLSKQQRKDIMDRKDAANVKK